MDLRNVWGVKGKESGGVEKKKHPITISDKLNALTIPTKLKSVIYMILFIGIACGVYQYQENLSLKYLLYALSFISMAIDNHYLWKYCEYVNDSDCDDWGPCLKALAWHSVTMGLFIGAVAAAF